MIGIYKYTNKINNKVYIGQSVNILARKACHKSSAYNPLASDYDCKFHKAIRKYGIENFIFEELVIIQEKEYSKELLDYLEKFYIKKFDSFKNGYNSTLGGNAGVPQKGEKNGRALLTKQDVEYIRECYNNHIPFREVLKEFESKISKRGLQKVWSFETWKDIHPEYNNEQNKKWHSHQAKANDSSVAKNNKRMFTPNQVILFRKEYFENKMGFREIIRKYNVECTPSTIRNAILGITYKDIQ